MAPYKYTFILYCVHVFALHTKLSKVLKSFHMIHNLRMLQYALQTRNAQNTA